MSPDRLASIRTPALSPKPYERTESPVTYTDQVLGQDTFDQAGFPTYEQYKAIETSYLDSLSSKRRPKALIPQVLFDRIWDVLIGAGHRETPQFRFWVRKTFRLTTLAEVDPVCEFGDPTRQVLVHEGLLVTVKEKIYSLLCYFHGKSAHAGRDKTCAFIRQVYTWIPKDLVALFVKMCPTCKSKRQGLHLNHFMINFASSAPPSPTLPMVHDSGTSSEPPSPALNDIAHSDGKPCFTNVGAHPLEMNSERRSIAIHQQMSAVLPMTTQAMPQQLVPTCLGLHGFPMSREVSLYQGLPNGWQFHSDYATAHVTCIEMKKLQLSHPGRHHPFTRRPRIPSVAPMMVPPSIDDPIAQQRDQEEQFGYIYPALLWIPGSVEQTSMHSDGKQTGQLHPDLSGDNETFRSLYTLEQLGDSEAFRSHSGSPHSLTPELVESTEDSPFATELSTPQDELFNELADILVIYDEATYIPLQKSIPTAPLTNAGP